MMWQSVKPSARRLAGFSRESEISMMKMRNTEDENEPKTLPWGTSALTGREGESIPLSYMLITRIEEISDS